MATFYVSPTGNDANSCAQAQNIATPKKTIASALSCMAAGDTLLIRAGTYAESINSSALTLPTGTSWANAPIIKAYPGETVQIKNVSLFDSYVQYMIFEGLIIDNGGIGNENVYISGGADHIRFKNCDIRNCIHQGVLTTGAGSDFNEFINCRVYDNGISGFDHGLYIDTSNNLIENCEIYNNSGYGVHIYGATAPGSNIVRDCIVRNNGAGVILSSGTGNLAYNNIIRHNSGNGLEISHNSVGGKAYNNTIFANGNFGIGVFGSFGSTGSIVKNNILYQNPTAIQSDEGGLVQSNNLTSDPSFVNSAGNDYHLQASSAAINFGISLADFTVDKDGNLRVGNYDAGAYEYTVVVPPPPLPSGTFSGSFFFRSNSSKNQRLAGDESYQLVISVSVKMP